MSEPIVAAVFIALTAAALGVMLYAMMPTHLVTYAVPPPPSDPQAIKWAWLVQTRDGKVALVLYPTASAQVASEVLKDVNILARVALWPGGYNCTVLVPPPRDVYKIGPDPYTGVWCPPPFKYSVPPGCEPRNVVARGRVVLIEAVC
ncbi:MAG: hypothetical protein QW085_06270 [Pyrobaculum sp.]